jgi:hypothetical protein
MKKWAGIGLGVLVLAGVVIFIATKEGNEPQKEKDENPKSLDLRI